MERLDAELESQPSECQAVNMSCNRCPGVMLTVSGGVELRRGAHSAESGLHKGSIAIETENIRKIMQSHLG